MIVLGWGKPLGYDHEGLLIAQHAVISYEPRGSLVTACAGRWSARDEWELLIGQPMLGVPRCAACLRAVLGARVIDEWERARAAHARSMTYTPLRGET